MDRRDRQLPRQHLSRADNAWMRLKHRTERLDANCEPLITDSLQQDPTATRPITEQEEPNRALVRMDRELPIWKKRATLMADPQRENDLTENAEPKFWHDQTDNDAPKFALQRTEQVDPQVTISFTEVAAPKRTYLRTDSEDAIDVPQITERVCTEPICNIPRIEQPLPKRATARIDIDEPTEPMPRADNDIPNLAPRRTDKVLP